MKNSGLSLNTKLMMAQLGALCLALAVFLVGILGGRWLLNHRYLSDEAVLAREQKLVRDLYTYL